MDLGRMKPQQVYTGAAGHGAGTSLPAICTTSCPSLSTNICVSWIPGSALEGTSVHVNQIGCLVFS